MRYRYIAALALIALAASSALAQPRATTAPASPQGSPHVVLLMIDALRPDHVGAWKNVRTVSPNLDRIAAEGVLLRNAFAPMPSSSPSRASILTGRAPHTHGVRINSRPLADEELTLAEIFADAGYQTVSTGRLRRGRAQGFQKVDLQAGRPGTETGMGPDSLAEVMWDEATYEAMPPEQPGTSSAVRAAIGWFRAHGNDAAPTFMWLDMPQTLHEAFRPPPPYDTMYDSTYSGRDVSVNPMHSPDLTPREIEHSLALYDGQVTYVDGLVGQLFDEMDRLGLADNTILVVMSDHGTFLGEHDLWQKAPVMLDPVMRATLMVRYPGIVPAGVQTDGLAQLSDVFATVLDLAGLEQPERSVAESRSLRPLMESTGPARDAVHMEFCLYKGTVGKAVRTDRWLYIHMQSVGDIPWGGGLSPGDVFRAHGWPVDLLFDIVADPEFTRNLAAERPEVVHELRDDLLRWLIATENDVPRE